MKTLIFALIVISQFSHASGVQELYEAAKKISKERLDSDMREVLKAEFENSSANPELEFDYIFCVQKEGEQCDRIVQYNFFGDQNAGFGRHAIVLSYSAYQSFEGEGIELYDRHSSLQDPQLDRYNIGKILPVLKELEKRYSGPVDILRTQPAYHPASIDIITLRSHQERVGMGTDDDHWEGKEKLLISFSEGLYSTVTAASWSYNFFVDVEVAGDDIKVTSILFSEL